MICGILPPFLLENIAERGGAEQRRQALRALSVDTSLRATRMQSSLLRAGHPRARADVLHVAPEDRPQRTIHDARGAEQLPGVLRRNEGDPPTRDKAVDEAYKGLGDTWSLYADVYDRRSIDDEGLALLATVHYGRDYDNAFWDGQRMVFGDGDATLFRRFTRSLDVIQSIADVFGSLVKQYALKQKAEQADWLIGADLLDPDVRGIALRSMKAPGTAYDDPVLGKDPQPASMRDFVHTTTDNGGVHINSGICNRAFYLAAVNLGGYA